jgi:hypothetical protein
MKTRDPSAPTQGSLNLTIVGGRPSEEESGKRRVPQGLEVLLKKASVDEEFRALLLEQRSRASETIALELDPAEATMLDNMPVDQLEAIVRGTRVREEDRRVFLGKAASVMLAALGAGVTCCPGCSKRGIQPDRVKTKGIQPDRVEKARPADAPARTEAGVPDPNRAPGVPPEHDPGAASTS